MPLSRSSLITIAVTALAGAGGAQDSSSLNARELFYKPVPVATKPVAKRTTSRPKPQPAPDSGERPVPDTDARNNKGDESPAIPVTNVSYAPLGLRYSVLKQQSDKSFLEVDADSVFHSGDRIRLQVESNGPAYLYVVMKGSSGKWQPLFPSPHIAGGDNHVDRGRMYTIPPGNQGWFTFDENAGEEKLFLVLSRQPEPDFEKLIYSIGTGASKPASDKPEPVKVMLAQNSAIGDDIVSRIRGQFASRDLVFEKVDDAAAPAGAAEKKETAVYVVNPNRGPDARLVVDMKLKHQ